ncbi:hypothetical protein BO79DRAFT_271397 [Aspergillus costaricaensis CBS 115574]|uniref:Uncharacterized protein n=1 Tax=Aspergillus costaricaensis CBS 115574 TaxID=1448317 RepID=A0ACD1I700_9EURO|nr:hypothetical protein BO79DRAFT_271397 [Aspergillus costaricaensis CBS 115574]RAK86142.1 hypothetical protein BO79DRAFT_271397 [Aspergillus costaricaensis CBS 115574]
MDVWSGMLIDVGCPDWETRWNKPVDRPWRSRKLGKQGTVGEAGRSSSDDAFGPAEPCTNSTSVGKRGRRVR